MVKITDFINTLSHDHVMVVSGVGWAHMGHSWDKQSSACGCARCLISGGFLLFHLSLVCFISAEIILKGT